MKTAISIPDSLFEAAENFAKRMGLSRSELYAKAIQEYLKAHSGDRITEQLNAVYAEEDSSLDPLLVQLELQTLSEDTW
ncbi:MULTISPECIES: ChpI protein [Calothrix]|uniref:ChpI protein n=2 Tax=Calothrix TaxID=1186 RepID=A0ABR8AHZ0_9CYAN|nr:MULTISPECIES: ChpI protein [Calothrix]MBD2198923.1 ChpI protein [Calothrix parietina FACHB-288]MBD2227220.1 ChpI protein [Calothrix anomala FACHB-343]